jgi:RES domain-containing protein
MAPQALDQNAFYAWARGLIEKEPGCFKPWAGVIFRSVSPKYAAPAALLSGEGAFRSGGRWNAPGLRAVYGSLEPGLAADESFNALLQHFGWENRDVPPRVIVAIRCSLESVLDLTGPPPLFAEPALADLLAEDWRRLNAAGMESRSQALGRLAAELGEGLRAPSRVRSGQNLVIYPSRLRPGSKLEVLGRDLLPE